MSGSSGNLTFTRRHYEDGEPSLGDEGAYLLPLNFAHPDDIARKLLKLDEFEHLERGEAKIDWLLKRDTKVKQGRQVLGTVHMPKVQGELNPLFTWMLARLFKRDPDFLIILDHDYWHSANDRGREILVYHELTHCIHKTDGFGTPRYDEDDRPVWGLRGHDVEEFTAVVRRYGAWNSDIQQFCAAIIAHAEETQVSSGAPLRS